MHPSTIGHTIGIAASASPFDRKEFDAGVDQLRSLGFKVWFDERIFAKERYFSGSDAARAQLLMDLFENSDISAIMFARGGYGSSRIIPLLDKKRIKKFRKPVIGFSDVTTLLLWLRQECDVPTFYGPVITQLGRATSKATLQSLGNVLMNNHHHAIDLQGAEILKKGVARGRLTGGCLSLIISSLATPYEIDTKKSILFFEDTGEKVYALDRMVTQLKHAGKLSSVAAILVGTVSPRESEPHDLRTMLLDVFSDFTGPLIMNVPAGHGDPFITLPLGAEVEVDARGTLPQLAIVQRSI
ncbi:MAG: LD-carboxypeptidase [Deltaproteobacteria bacterium]|nr:LD-carboxypeptidase [Deltaproteobacteria bacterium]